MIITRDRKKIITALQKEGFRPCADAAAKQILFNALALACMVFFERVINSPLYCVGVYHISEQKEPYSGADALILSDDRRISSIFISSEALKNGLTFTVFLLLHEFAHLFCKESGHSAVFEALLDELLTEFERQTTFHLDNDYLGYGQSGIQFARITNKENDVILKHWQRAKSMLENERGAAAVRLASNLLGENDDI